MKNIIITYFALCLCACADQDVVDNKPLELFDIENYARTEKTLITQEIDSVIKYVGESPLKKEMQAKKIATNSEGFSLLFTSLNSYNLNLPNLIYEYSVDTIVLSDTTLIRYLPNNSDLHVRSLTLKVVNNKVVELHGIKENTGFFSDYYDEIKYTHPGIFYISNKYNIIMSQPQPYVIYTKLAE